MKTPLLLSTLVLAFVVGCSDDSSSTAKQTATNSPAPSAAPGDYAGGMVRAQQLATKTASLTSINEAIQMFKAEKGRNPKSLNELVPNYIARIPQAPAGMRLVYNPATGQASMAR